MTQKTLVMLLGCMLMGSPYVIGTTDTPKTQEATHQSNIDRLDEYIKALRARREKVKLDAQLEQNETSDMLKKDWNAYHHEIVRQKILEQEVNDIDATVAELEQEKNRLKAEKK